MTELAAPWSDKIIFTAWQRVVRYLQQANKEAWGSAVIIDPGVALQVGPKNYPAPEIEVI